MTRRRRWPAPWMAPARHLQFRADRALQDARQPATRWAQWQLGLMYESGEGVAQDKAKAFGYFAQIADQPPTRRRAGTRVDIVAHSRQMASTTRMDSGSRHRRRRPVDQAADARRQLFWRCDAQYPVGEMYLGQYELGDNPIQSARWLSLAPRKGYARRRRNLATSFQRQWWAQGHRSRADVLSVATSGTGRSSAAGSADC